MTDLNRLILSLSRISLMDFVPNSPAAISGYSEGSGRLNFPTRIELAAKMGNYLRAGSSHRARNSFSRLVLLGFLSRRDRTFDPERGGAK